MELKPYTDFSHIVEKKQELIGREISWKQVELNMNVFEKKLNTTNEDC